MISRTLNLITVALILCLLVPTQTAFAEIPEGAPGKGSIPAASTVIQIVQNDENEQWTPAPVSVERMKIGLCYDDSAQDTVSFENLNGWGFSLGNYNEQRLFCPETELSASEIVIRSEGKWHVLFDEVFPSEEDALAYAERNTCTAILLDGEYRVIYGSYPIVEEVQYLIRKHGFEAVPWQDEEIGVYDGQGRLLFLLDGGRDIAVMPLSSGKPETAFQNRSYCGGFLLKKDPADRFAVINVVDLEDYVKGVIPYEMNAAWPMEALKAQAVCARTYAAYNVNAYEEYGFDLRDDAESQVYRGTGAADETTDRAVDETKGMFLRYQGEICEVYYFSSDGGATEDGANVFGSDRPYLAGKTDPFEYAMEDAVIKWSRIRGGEYIGQRLTEEGYPVGKITAIVPEYSELGNVVAMTYTDENGVSIRLENRESYSLLYLDNCRFTVEPADDGFLFTGRGWGHNCGMSQWGACAMAKYYGYSCEDILRFYFTGAYVA